MQSIHLFVFIFLLFVSSGCVRHASENLATEPVRLDSEILGQKVKSVAELKNLSVSQRKIVDPYIGLTEHDARSLAAEQNRKFRLSGRDNELFAMTAEFYEGRITAHIVDGVVASCDIEGCNSNLNGDLNGDLQQIGERFH